MSRKDILVVFEVARKDFIIASSTLVGLFSGDRMVYLAKMLNSDDKVVNDILKYLCGTDKT